MTPGFCSYSTYLLPLEARKKDAEVNVDQEMLKTVRGLVKASHFTDGESKRLNQELDVLQAGATAMQEQSRFMGLGEWLSDRLEKDPNDAVLKKTLSARGPLVKALRLEKKGDLPQVTMNLDEGAVVVQFPGFSDLFGTVSSDILEAFHSRVRQQKVKFDDLSDQAEKLTQGLHRPDHSWKSKVKATDSFEKVLGVAKKSILGESICGAAIVKLIGQMEKAKILNMQ